MQPSSTASPRTVRAAILGYGLAGQVFHAPLISSVPGMSVAALVTGSPERQQKAHADYPQATVYSTADELWRDAGSYDLAVIATPNRAHVALGLAALDAGLPIVVDKPVAASAADAERLVEASKRAGKLFSVFQNRRWDGDFLTVKQMIAQNLLGNVVRYESRFERYRPGTDSSAWREFAAPEEGGGLLFDLGAHLIDQAMQLFGQPVAVYAEAEQRRPGAQVDDDTFVALHFANGVRAHLWMNVVARILAPRFLIHGLHGSYEKYGLDPQEPAMAAGARPGDPGWGEEPPERWGRISTDVGGLHVDGKVETLPGAYEQYYAGIRDAITSGGPSPVDPAESIAALRVIEAARESAREGRLIQL
jgi:scyllo-inositol 2-dehydrogenase (NADP+)